MAGRRRRAAEEGVPPFHLFALLALAVPVTGAVAAIVVQRRTDGANVAEELRYAG